MGTKANPGRWDCYANAHPDEPMFVLLGRDKFGASLVALWTLAREADGESADKVAETRDCEAAMKQWVYALRKKSENVLDFVPFDVLAQALRKRGARVMPAPTEHPSQVLDPSSKWPFPITTQADSEGGEA
jgi:hypothetical protein